MFDYRTALKTRRFLFLPMTGLKTVTEKHAVQVFTSLSKKLKALNVKCTV